MDTTTNTPTRQLPFTRVGAGHYRAETADGSRVYLVTRTGNRWHTRVYWTRTVAGVVVRNLDHYRSAASDRMTDAQDTAERMECYETGDRAGMYAWDDVIAGLAPRP